MKSTIVEKMVINNNSRTEMYAIATSVPNPFSIMTSLTYEAFLTEWNSNRRAVERLQQQIETIA